jgi:nickel transport protein
VGNADRRPDRAGGIGAGSPWDSFFRASNIEAIISAQLCAAQHGTLRRIFMQRIMLLTLAIILFSTSALLAHDAWVAKDGDVLVVTYGHGDKLEAYKPAYVKAAKAFNATGTEISTAITAQATRAILAPAQAPAMTMVFFDSGAWVKTPEGHKNVSKREAKDVISSLKSQKYSKNVWQWNDRFSQPMGGKMELVPLKNPLSLKAGDKLPFQVLYEGKPLAGATVAAAGVEKDRLKTDANGRAVVAIEKKGFNLVSATRKTDIPKDPDADVLYEAANITFEVK